MAILAVGATQSTFVPGDDSAPVVASLLPLTLASDHRVVDGALAARFLQHLCRVLQTPSLMFA
ncbi:MAG: 2-oxo acid dehydrogenase subunit E2 [Tetrasphaera sp.]